jgi:hypothetical protein
MSDRSDLKLFFKTGEKPTEGQYEDLIDSVVHKAEDKANLAEAADETINDKYITPKTAKRAVETHLPASNTTDAGIVRRSSADEVNNGANVNAYVTPSNVVNAIEARAPELAPVQSVNNMTGDVVIDLGTDSGWQTPALGAGLTAFGGTYQSPRFRNKNGVVYIEGIVKGGTSGGSVTIFTLPTDYRPNKTLIFVVQTLGGITRLDVTSSGDVKIYNYDSSWSSITGVSFVID